MNYLNHNLRTTLQEWLNRIARVNHVQFGNELKILLNNLQQNKQLSSVLLKISEEFTLDDDEFNKISKRRQFDSRIDFESEAHRAAFYYQFITKYVVAKDTYDIRNHTIFIRGNYQETVDSIIENYLTPIINYLHDSLDKSSSIIYLLEKYKKRTEWFTKKELFLNYSTAEKSYEQILEDDLRLFLFDQGIEYPFSTPASASGRADIVGNIETEDPLIVEVKIFDKSKNYGKNRIKEGLHQIIMYANDHNKDVGYLVVFNMDEEEINLDFKEKSNVFPPRIIFNNRVFYFIIINVGIHKSASKSGNVKEVRITEDELIS